LNRTIITQSLFHEEVAQSSSWRSHTTSVVAHLALILAALFIVIPAAREIRKTTHESITYVAPVLPEYRPKVTIQRPVVIPHPTVARNIEPPKPTPTIKPVVPPPPKPQPTIAPAPEIAAATPTVRPVPEPKFDVPAPKPEVRVGAFANTEAAKSATVPNTVKTGGFGDPHGVAPSPDSRQSAAMLAKVGSFDLPNGAGKAGGGGQSASGGVKTSAFGDMGSGSANTSGSRGTVHAAGFGDASATTAGPTVQRAAAAPLTTPVEILSKPKPLYTQEARDLKLEGQVSLEVVFLANGTIRIVRVVHGLGHGLDEAAKQAAQAVRFKPATRAGVAVDSDATINITFQLT
jgi:TonB family protein